MLVKNLSNQILMMLQIVDPISNKKYKKTAMKYICYKATRNIRIKTKKIKNLIFKLLSSNNINYCDDASTC